MREPSMHAREYVLRGAMFVPQVSIPINPITRSGVSDHWESEAA